MQVDIICIGSELLNGLVDNTNAGYLSRRLGSAGITVRQQIVVADETGAIGNAVSEALRHSDALICSGGLGPTEDDLTREAVADALGKGLLLNRERLSRLERFFRERGYDMPAANRKQAMQIEGGTLVDNPQGTAPGTVISHEGKLIILLPGPPQELEPMFEEAILPLLSGRVAGRVYLTRTLKCVGLGESLLEEKIRALRKWDQPALSLSARGLEVQLQLKAVGRPEQAALLLESAAAQLKEALRGWIYGEEEDTLAGTVAQIFTRRGQTLAAAESLSGGLLADSLTDIPGSSHYFKGSAVTYNPSSKLLLPGFNKKILAHHGAVSAAAAEAMAEGAREYFSADVGVGITGLAGPDSDESGSPVGLVYAAVAQPGRIEIKEFKFTGTRRAVKERAVQGALLLLWRTILPGKGEGT